MNSTTRTDERQEIGLLDALNGEWLRLPLAAMQDVGPVAQTLAALLRLTNRETFMEVAKIAVKARLPVSTVRKHLVALDEHGWIVHAGRQRTRGGRLRRTATIKVSKKATDRTVPQPYGILPWWACCVRLPWCAKAVLALVISRLVGIVQGIAGRTDTDPDDEDLIASLGEHDERFRFSLRYLMAQTGLWRDAVIRAKLTLHKMGIVKYSEGGYCDEADTLLPNYDFRAVITPLVGHPGYVQVTCKRGSGNDH